MSPTIHTTDGTELYPRIPTARGKRCQDCRYSESGECARHARHAPREPHTGPTLLELSTLNDADIERYSR